MEQGTKALKSGRKRWKKKANRKKSHLGKNDNRGKTKRETILVEEKKKMGRHKEKMGPLERQKSWLET